MTAADITGRVYVAGPMTGRPDLNFPAFNEAAVFLRSLGCDAVNPAEINPDHSMPWGECMRRDIAQLVTCDAVWCLPGWKLSRGATLEVYIAHALNLLVLGAPE